ncbi:MAG: GNAT family N-acetyltransferase [Vicinamibacterales bacterium]
MTRIDDDDQKPLIPSFLPLECDPSAGRIQARPFQRGDAAALARFWREREFDIPGGLYHDVASVDAGFVLQSMRKHRVVCATVAVRDEQIVGYLEIREFSPGVLHVCYLYLSPEIRGIGYGAEFAFLVYRYIASLPPGRCRRAVSNFSPSNAITRRLALRVGSPETAPGRVELLLPALLSTHVFRQFAKRHGLVTSFDRYCQAVSLDVAEVCRIRSDTDTGVVSDRFEWQGLPVYPQRFAVGDDWFDMLIEARSLDVCHVACSDWSATLVPLGVSRGHGARAACEVRVTNTSPGLLPVQFSADPAPTLLDPGDTLSLEAALRTSRQAGRRVWVRCRVGESAVRLGVHLPVKRQPRRLSDRPAAAARATPTPAVAAPLTLRRGEVGATVEPALGGSLRSLHVSGREALQYSARGTASLGWIHPWRGGLFYLLDDGRRTFRLDAWGPSPGVCGFESEPTGCVLIDAHTVVRTSARGPLAEATTFQLEDDGLVVRTLIENTSTRPRVVAFALFAFLVNPDPAEAARAVSAEGASRRRERRSFELSSERHVALETPEQVVTLDAREGRLVLTAFNLGDDGMHLMARCAMELQPRTKAPLSLGLRIAARAAETQRARPGLLTGAAG